ncbi:hypothetical protein [Altericroceibacterium endophyticum]|uniref:Uncharacterized protein n=1 Tax=Altericroceibacterium endophyticum TaxID=1808508 RepID=A0A6I4T455_9SPHN|nr:hypothetical protein [Altericroceibacterium endophyticum]MXO64750.1 hypothetical protein [Altericroceibacterium endophyticum]
MNRSLLLTGTLFALTSTLALAAPESLLPPGFDNPAPAPAPSPAPVQSARPDNAPAPAAAPRQSDSGDNSSSGTAVVQPLPQDNARQSSSLLPDDFPSLAEIEAMDDDEVDEIFGLKPKFDTPPAARRAVEQIGVIGPEEGGMPISSLSAQPASLVRTAIAGTGGPVVSRWGHILLRRVLSSRLDTPQGMEATEFAALRAALLNRMGESLAARSLVQDIDSANYTKPLADAAFDSYLATGDILGMCPVARLKSDLRDDAEWELLRSVCSAYSGNSRDAGRDLQRALSRGVAPRIDVLLAQRYAGAAGDARRAVNIEWDKVENITPWRFAFANALGLEMPDALTKDLPDYYQRSAVLIPAMPLPDRAASADLAAREGILSAAAMVDLYSQIYGNAALEGEWNERATRLRNAYVAADTEARLTAMESLWADADGPYAGQVLTAYAAARLPVNEAFLQQAPQLIASMLTAGLDRNALRWSAIVPEGSEGWALLALAQPAEQIAVSESAVDGFIDDDDSAEQRKSRFLIAGLAGLNRLDDTTVDNFSERLALDLDRETRWSQMIDEAAEYRNGTLVALLAGLGMQGEGWDRMTARHLFHIVRGLDRAGLNAEARMIAAEAVARG